MVEYHLYRRKRSSRGALSEESLKFRGFSGEERELPVPGHIGAVYTVQARLHQNGYNPFNEEWLRSFGSLSLWASTGVNDSVQEEITVRLDIADTAEVMGRRAAAAGARCIIRAIAERGRAAIIVATGTSQFPTMDALTATEGIDWSKVTGFHLDEYIGMPMTHPASFRGYLKQRLVDRVGLAAFHYIDGEVDGETECTRVGRLLEENPIDVAFIGIGENGHLAFNDPPADFDTKRPYLLVELDEACRRQQLGEGWFPRLEDVPTHAISMSIRQIVKAATIVCSVPEQRKAKAVRSAVEGPVTPDVPASILQEHADTTLYLDAEAAGLLRK